MSTSSIPVKAMFLLLDEFWATSEPKSGEESLHPDKGVCQFGLLILHLSSRSVSFLNHIGDYQLRFISKEPNSSRLRSTRDMTMAATSPVGSVWTPKTTKLCHLLSRRPQVVSSCQLVVALPLVSSYPASWLLHCLLPSSPCATLSSSSRASLL